MSFTNIFKLALIVSCFLATHQCLPQLRDTEYTGQFKENEELWQFRNLFLSPFLPKVCENKYDNFDLVRLANGHVYHFSSTQLSWANSKTACETMNMRLVTFDDLYESLLVQVEMLRRNIDDDDYLWFALNDPNGDKLYTWTYSGQFYSVLHYVAVDDYLWFALNDPNGDKLYTWTYSGQRVTFSNWKPNEPSDASQCGIIDPGSNKLSTSGWDAHDCTHTHYYACEIPQECDKFVNAPFKTFAIATL